MIIAYLNQGKLIPQEVTAENNTLLLQAVWIDLISPTRDEEKLVENAIGACIPTPEEMREIEVSSRLYRENGNLFMTAMMLAKSETPDPCLDAVSFILTKNHLVTLRYIQPVAFKLFIAQLSKLDPEYYNPIELFIELLDATVDRLADILEVISHHLDDYSHAIFTPLTNGEKRDYQSLMQRLGKDGDLNTKTRESLMTFSRLIAFFMQAATSKLSSDMQLRLSSQAKDINSLSDHAGFLSTKVNFLLDATLGMVSIEQNNIIKIFSVAAVIFLPPTLIASIYGMNFRFMPELMWHGGYYTALGLMILSAIVPYKYFKRRKWL